MSPGYIRKSYANQFASGFITLSKSGHRNSVNVLKELQQLTFDEFAVDHILNASAERHFQVAIQAALDIGSDYRLKLERQS